MKKCQKSEKSNRIQQSNPRVKQTNCHEPKINQPSLHTTFVFNLNFHFFTQSSSYIGLIYITEEKWVILACRLLIGKGGRKWESRGRWWWDSDDKLRLLQNSFAFSLSFCFLFLVSMVSWPRHDSSFNASLTLHAFIHFPFSYSPPSEKHSEIIN